MGVNNYFLLTQTISRLILGTGEDTSIFIHSLLKLCVIKMTLDAYTCLRMFWIYKNHSSLINHHLRNVNRSSPPGFQENNWPYICLLGTRCKTLSLQHGPWWPPRKQTKKKPQKRQQKNFCPFLTLEAACTWQVYQQSLHWLSHPSDWLIFEVSLVIYQSTTGRDAQEHTAHDKLPTSNWPAPSTNCLFLAQLCLCCLLQQHYPIEIFLISTLVFRWFTCKNDSETPHSFSQTNPTPIPWLLRYFQVKEML